MARTNEKTGVSKHCAHSDTPRDVAAAPTPEHLATDAQTQSQSLTHSPRQDDGWGWALPDSAPRKETLVGM
jgi:hypothetical protein